MYAVGAYLILPALGYSGTAVVGLCECGLGLSSSAVQAGVWFEVAQFLHHSRVEVVLQLWTIVLSEQLCTSRRGAVVYANKWAWHFAVQA